MIQCGLVGLKTMQSRTQNPYKLCLQPQRSAHAMGTHWSVSAAPGHCASPTASHAWAQAGSVPLPQAAQLFNAYWHMAYVTLGSQMKLSASKLISEISPSMPYCLLLQLEKENPWHTHVFQSWHWFWAWSACDFCSYHPTDVVLSLDLTLFHSNTKHKSVSR